MQYLKFQLLLLAALFIVTPASAQSISWKGLEEAQKIASAGDKKIMIYAEAKWCGYCKKMENNVFPKKEVVDSLHKYFLPVRLDIESNEQVTFVGQTLAQKELARVFRVSRTPTFIFLNSDGKVMGTQPGYLPSDVFKALVSYVGLEIFKKKIPFESYLQEKSIKVE